jgi:arabinofuranosyltransferase
MPRKGSRKTLATEDGNGSEAGVKSAKMVFNLSNVKRIHSMSDATDVLTTTRNALIDLVHPQKQVELEQKRPDAQADETERRDKYRKTVIIFALVFFVFVLVKNAWLSDDSYITLRTVYNFVHGFGLTWNIDERVQTFTHPLWMFLLSGSYFFMRSIYFSSLLLSLGVSTLAVSIFVFRLAPSTLVAVVGLTILAASKSFIDYSTSGLENPLTHLLIVLFALVFFQYQQSKRYLLWLSLLGCMMILNRMDTVLLFLPALIYAWYRSSQPRLKALKTIFLAFIPFIAWELFSLFYYGFLFPNTAYAKLNTGISTGQLVKQGVVYLIGSSTFDPLLFLVIVSAVVLVVVLRDWKSIPLLLGMLLYIAYIVKVGGDFMDGRFLTPPFLLAVILLIRNIPSSSKLIYAGMFLAAVLLGFLVPNSRWYVINPSAQFTDITAPSGLMDEHYYYASASDLLNFRRDVVMPNSPLTQAGLHVQQMHEKVVVFDAIGYFGYAAGPQVHVLDDLALGDPLLARLPLSPNELNKWRIGHFLRDIPAGYVKTLETGKNMIQDPGLAQYYAKLHDVVSGPLFSWQRLLEIWHFNTGGYNYLLQHYIQSLPSQSQAPRHFPFSTPDYFNYASMPAGQEGEK